MKNLKTLGERAVARLENAAHAKKHNKHDRVRTVAKKAHERERKTRKTAV